MERTGRDLYDSKRLPPAQPALKQLSPPVPTCMREMRRYWSNPFKSKLSNRGFFKMEIYGMKKLGWPKFQQWRLQVAFHLHPNHHFLLTSSTTSPPESFRRATGMWQSVCSLNATTLLSAYQVEIMEEMGRQLDSGT